MADTVTYAELKFADAAINETRHAVHTLEHHNEDGDVMYENVDGLQPPREKKERRPPPNPTRGGPLIQGFRERSCHLCLVFFMLCLTLCTALIGLAVTYVKTSHDLQRAETSYHTQSSRMAKSMSSQEKLLESVMMELNVMKEKLDKTQIKLEEADKDLNQTLWQCQMEERTCTTNRNTMEGTLKDTENELEDTRAALAKTKEEKRKVDEMLLDTQRKQTELENDMMDLCPEGWVLFAKKCLWFSHNWKTWEDSEKDCAEKYSNLIIVEQNDTRLKLFLSEKKGTFWVGKKWNKQSKKWEWPYGTTMYYSNYCWRARAGELNYDYCWKKHGWVCEKNVVVTSWNKSSHHSLQFTLWGSDIYCHSERYQ